MKDDRLYLAHIAECIRRIASYTADGRAAFLADEKTQDAVLRNLQVMAESTQQLSGTVKQRHGKLDWRGLSGFRNILVHAYLGVKMERIWELVERQLPDLREAVSAMQDDLAGDSQ